MVICICFPPTASVRTTNGSSTLVKDLNSSSTLLTVSKSSKKLKPTKFLTYIHIDSEQSASFTSIITQNGAKLCISPAHLLFYFNEKSELCSKQAGEVKIGDSLVHIDEINGEISGEKVVKISSETFKGIYAPLTTCGKLIVDGFLVSSYAHVQSHEIAHMSLAPLRLWYKSMGKINKEEKLGRVPNKIRTPGIHSYAKFLMTITRV